MYWMYNTPPHHTSEEMRQHFPYQSRFTFMFRFPSSHILSILPFAKEMCYVRSKYVHTSTMAKYQTTEMNKHVQHSETTKRAKNEFLGRNLKGESSPEVLPTYLLFTVYVYSTQHAARSEQHTAKQIIQKLVISNTMKRKQGTLTATTTTLTIIIKLVSGTCVEHEYVCIHTYCLYLA